MYVVSANFSIYTCTYYIPSSQSPVHSSSINSIRNLNFFAIPRLRHSYNNYTYVSSDETIHIPTFTTEKVSTLSFTRIVYFTYVWQNFIRSKSKHTLRRKLHCNISSNFRKKFLDQVMTFRKKLKLQNGVFMTQALIKWLSLGYLTTCEQTNNCFQIHYEKFS